MAGSVSESAAGHFKRTFSWTGADTSDVQQIKHAKIAKFFIPASFGVTLEILDAGVTEGDSVASMTDGEGGTGLNLTVVEGLSVTVTDPAKAMMVAASDRVALKAAGSLGSAESPVLVVAELNR